jgi:hypothetical protein
MPIIYKRRPDAGQRFPFIPLPRAIERSRELYKVALAHEVPIATAMKAWAYGDKSSGGLQTAAALKSFGLLEDVAGSEVRKVKLTDAALRIIRDPRDISPDRDALIREAALSPPLHREIIEKYGGMPPSDEALKAFLLIDRSMKDEAVPEFIREFTATMAFAKVPESGTIQDMNIEDAAVDRFGNELAQGSGLATTPNRASIAVTGSVTASRERPIGRYDYEDGSYVRIVVGGEVDTEAALEMVETLIDLKRKELKRRRPRDTVSTTNTERQHPSLSGPDEGFLSDAPRSQPKVTDWEQGGR